MRLDILQNAHHLLVHQRVGVRHRNVQQDILRTRDQVVIQERRTQRSLGCSLGAVVAFGRSHGHMRAAAIAHHLRHIGEVDVHQVAFDRDDLGDALRRRTQDVVGLAERLLERQAPVYFENILIVDNQQRIDILAQFLDPAESLFVADLTLDGQRRGNDRHSQQPHLLGQLGDDGRSARTRTAAHAGRDEQHPSPGLFEVLADFRQRLDCGTAAVLRVVPRTEPYLLLHGTLVQRLLVGIANHERHAPYTQVPHMVHGIPAGTADTYHHNDRPVRLRGFDFRHQFVCHISLLLSSD